MKNMKKQLLLLAGGAIIFASCGSNNNNASQTQAQIDSTVNAKMAEHDAANAAKSDSTLKAMEKEKAEAMIHEKHEEHKEHHASKGNEPAPTPAPAPQTIGNGKPAMSNQNTTPTNSGTVGNGKPSMKNK